MDDIKDKFKNLKLFETMPIDGGFVRKVEGGHIFTTLDPTTSIFVEDLTIRRKRDKLMYKLAFTERDLVDVLGKSKDYIELAKEDGLGTVDGMYPRHEVIRFLDSRLIREPRL